MIAVAVGANQEAGNDPVTDPAATRPLTLAEVCKPLGASASAPLAARYPMPYPSIEDRRLAIAGDYGPPGLPVTAFYDARGKRVLVHQGPYTSEAQLATEIDRYALGRTGN